MSRFLSISYKENLLLSIDEYVLLMFQKLDSEISVKRNEREKVILAHSVAKIASANCLNIDVCIYQIDQINKISRLLLNY